MIDDSGRAAILYWGTARILGRTIGYASTFLAPSPVSDEPTEPNFEQRATARRGDPPREIAAGIEFHHRRLDLEAHFEPVEPPIERRLLETKTDFVDWSVRAPRARAKVRIGETTLEGWGYVETLRMTIPPWDLPIDTLHWGRALSNQSSAVWIRWEGSSPLSLLYLDGVEIADPEITTERVAGGRAVELTVAETLRDAPIGPRLISSIPGISLLTPASILAAMETKWLSRASGLTETAETSPAWAIHEIVRFKPKDRD